MREIIHQGNKIKCPGIITMGFKTWKPNWKAPVIEYN